MNTTTEYPPRCDAWLTTMRNGRWGGYCEALAVVRIRYPDDERWRPRCRACADRVNPMRVTVEVLP